MFFRGRRTLQQKLLSRARFSQLINIKTRVGGINWQTVVTLFFEIVSHHVGIPRRAQQTYVENAVLCAVLATRKELRSQARKRKKTTADKSSFRSAIIIETLRRVMRHCNDDFLARWGSYSFPLPFCFFRLNNNKKRVTAVAGCRPSDRIYLIAYPSSIICYDLGIKKLKTIATHQIVIRVRSCVTMFNRIRRYTNLSSL